jgi:two-component system OmpR family sensor kinase
MRHISGLAPTRVPEEIVPLVESYNSVLTRLRKAFDSQSHFLQDAAHELRTPITAISLQLENLRQHIAPGEASDRFAQLEAGVVRARHLVAQLLSLTRQDGNDISPKMADIALESLLKESIEQLMVLADQRGIDIGFTGSGEHHIWGDRSELRSLFDNLIANAMLHTPEGTIVDVELKESGSNIVVEIIDNGPGMPEEFIPRAFDRFARSAGAEIQGSGLGLTITQSVALRHGIKVELQNRYANQQVMGLCVRVILEKRH